MDKMDKVEIVYRDPRELTPYENNSREHPPIQMARLRKAIKTYGFTNPVIIDENDVILCGNGRTRAAIDIGLDEIPTIKLTHLSEAKKKAFIIADNKVSNLGAYNRDIMSEEVCEIAKLKEIDDFDFDALCMTCSDLDELLHPDKSEIDFEDLRLPNTTSIMYLEGAADRRKYDSAVAKIEALNLKDYFRDFALLAAAKLIEYDMKPIEKFANSDEASDNEKAALHYCGLIPRPPKWLEARLNLQEQRRRKRVERLNKAAEKFKQYDNEPLFFGKLDL